MLQPMFASAIKDDVCKVSKATLEPRVASIQKGEDDVNIYAKTIVTRSRNIQVIPVREKLTSAVPRRKEADILEAFSCTIQIGSMLLQIPPTQDEIKPNFRTPPKML